MPGYAVKVGEIILRSDKPITEEQRTRAVRILLARAGKPILTSPALEAVIVIGGCIEA